MLRLELTDIEMKLFLQIYSLGDMVYEAVHIPEEDYNPNNRVRQLEKKILKTVEKSDSKKLVKRWGDKNEIVSLVDDLQMEAEETLEEYRQDILYTDLPVILGQRDMQATGDDKILLWNGEDFSKNLSDEEWKVRDARLTAYYEKYEDEFEENGFDNLRIVRNPLFVK